MGNCASPAPPDADVPLEIGIVGTFDVQNYGDLLFPIVAEHELKRRLGAINLHRFSYHPAGPPAWPYPVTSIDELPEVVSRLDGLLLGGGHVVRFDKAVAPRFVPPRDGPDSSAGSGSGSVMTSPESSAGTAPYAPPSPLIHHPTGYWLTPALLAIQHNVPVAWNAPGVHIDSPAWAVSLVRQALDGSRYVAVRDERSREILERYTDAQIEVVPDTVFGVASALGLGEAPSEGYRRVCADAAITGPYVVVQASTGAENYLEAILASAERFTRFQFLVLPVGPINLDEVGHIQGNLPSRVELARWPAPDLMAEIIARSEAVIGRSLHLAITALAFGVPVFTRPSSPDEKYSVLSSLPGVHEIPPDERVDADWLVARFGKSPVSEPILDMRRRLSAHWDRIAGELRGTRTPTAPAVNRFWQGLPLLLEDAAVELATARSALDEERAIARERNDRADRELLAADEALSLVRMELDRQTADKLALAAAGERLARDLQATRASLAQRDQLLALTHSTLSWRLTAPARGVAERVRKRRTNVIDLDRYRRYTLETEPFQWGRIDGIYRENDATALAATYPRDHFKLVSGMDPEKGYEYEARNLVHLGADTPTFADDLSPAWRALAADLLSRGYREVMSKLSGIDLSDALLEVNVYHYGMGDSLGVHLDLPDKLVTNVLYFNRVWDCRDGGCLQILRSSDSNDLHAQVLPIVGTASFIMRSENSWHAVARVTNASAPSRRSVTATWYRPGSTSPMWPEGDDAELHSYDAPDLDATLSERSPIRRVRGGLRRLFGRG